MGKVIPFMPVNRTFKILKYLILGLALLFTLVLIGVNLPFIQRLITEKANAFFLKKDLPVHVDNISLLINGKIGVTRPLIMNNQGDTMVYVEKIRVFVRIFPLLLKKVKVNNLTLRDARVQISTDVTTGKLDLVALFSQGGKNPKKKKSGKKWDIQVSSVNLKNIRFTYNDSLHGIRIDQSIGNFYARFDRFSLTRRQLYAAYLDLENVKGGIILRPGTPKKNNRNKPQSSWKFKLDQSALKDILFTLRQPVESRGIEVSLGRGGISDAGFDLAGSRIYFAGIMLQEPGVTMLSSPVPAKTKSGSGEDAGSDFPGKWNITGGNIKITRGSVNALPYQTASRPYGKERSFQITGLNSNLKDLKLSTRKSGFTMNQLSSHCRMAFSLTKGKYP